MEKLDFLNKLDIKNLDEFNSWDEWYDYMINDYIPEKGKKEMEAFLNAGFNINAYLLWKCKEEGMFNDEMADAIEKKVGDLRDEEV